MKELFVIENRKIGTDKIKTVSARDVHSELGSKKDFTDWMKARIAKYGFIEGEDYIVLLPYLGEQKEGKGGANKVDYFISLDMAKELGMVESTQKGREVRRYFIAREKQLANIEKQRLTFDWQEARENGKCIRNVMTSAIACLERTADKQGGAKLDKDGKNIGRKYYSTVTKMIYKELFGDGKLKDVRDKLDVMQLNFLTVCEQACATEIERLCDLELDYHNIYSEAKILMRQVVEGLSTTKLESKKESVVKLAWESKQDEHK